MTRSNRPARRQAIESVCIGAGIGVAIIVVRATTASGSQGQVAALAFVAVALVAAQVWLLRRRGASRPAPLPPRRPSQRDLFARELDGRWTGLTDTAAPDAQPAGEARPRGENPGSQPAP